MPCGSAQIIFQSLSTNIYDFEMNLEDKNTDCLDTDDELYLSSLINSCCSQTHHTKTISTKLQYSSCLQMIIDYTSIIFKQSFEADVQSGYGASGMILVQWIVLVLTLSPISTNGLLLEGSSYLHY